MRDSERKCFKDKAHCVSHVLGNPYCLANLLTIADLFLIIQRVRLVEGVQEEIIMVKILFK